jgi:hypothetical protein
MKTKYLPHRKKQCPLSAPPRSLDEEFYNAVVLFFGVMFCSPRREVAREAARWLPVFVERRRQAVAAARAAATARLMEGPSLRNGKENGTRQGE